LLPEMFMKLMLKLISLEEFYKKELKLLILELLLALFNLTQILWLFKILPLILKKSLMLKWIMLCPSKMINLNF
jgi:hypothetical protein